ncbi:electron transfer flavoprotein [Synechococcales cyanobacterium C]|uniref:Electron transfer flavoprotein n=1 Tax=Petrachloros mirabilis ULC683 TaxID=2781853 RepID=A0A8K1ZYP2_9CYAN|nr:DM13 domain-containing protein [Petrachloros mirabilis]NCJ06272.1 electron transfer flavoprotein [Petrachloros mirabilis ULC683]
MVKSILLIVLSSVFLSLAACTETATDMPPSEVGTTTAEVSEAGMFVPVEKTTTGQVVVRSENGRTYLEFSEDFQTSSGPDLHVLLDIASTPPDAYANIASYVKLGSLESARGAQRYEVPEDVQVADYQSVVIWCEQFDMVYGYAPL